MYEKRKKYVIYFLFSRGDVYEKEKIRRDNR